MSSLVVRSSSKAHFGFGPPHTESGVGPFAYKNLRHEPYWLAATEVTIVDGPIWRRSVGAAYTPHWALVIASLLLMFRYGLSSWVLTSNMHSLWAWGS